MFFMYFLHLISLKNAFRKHSPLMGIIFEILAKYHNGLRTSKEKIEILPQSLIFRVLYLQINRMHKQAGSLTGLLLYVNKFQ